MTDGYSPSNIGDVIETYYPSKLLGFITTNGTSEAVVQCSVNPLRWDDIQQNFIVEIELGLNFDVSFVFIPIESVAHPLCVIPNILIKLTGLLLYYRNKIGVVTLEIMS